MQQPFVGGGGLAASTHSFNFELGSVIDMFCTIKYNVKGTLLRDFYPHIFPELTR